MSELETLADHLHRTVKLALDTGEASSVDEAVAIFSAYRVQFIVGPDVAENAALQAALLTAVNCAARTLLGGVSVIGIARKATFDLQPLATASETLRRLGATIQDLPRAAVPTVIVGQADYSDDDSPVVRVVVNGWCGGVLPATRQVGFENDARNTTAGVLAGALAVSEIFQRLRGHVAACRRSIGLNLWRPDVDWLGSDRGPAISRLPTSAWLVGLGNLGQAYLWTLGLLPHRAGDCQLVLQDFDVLAASNVSTSLLTWPADIGQRKSRAMSAWAEAHGFRTTIVERHFAANFHVAAKEPAVALIGVDNPLARQAAESVGFERVIDAGLGRGPRDFLGINVHTFPAARPANSIWTAGVNEAVEVSQPAYQGLLDQTGDKCGLVRLAGRTIGAPFVGCVAAAIVVAELLRLAMAARRNEFISCHLRDLSDRTVIRGEPWQPFNPGTMPLSNTLESS